ncbi:cation-translocating P-type ATPase [Chlamydiales bacterium]|nr:cation-translocating P-type ATPase [Chlamydiales bacterium]
MSLCILCQIPIKMKEQFCCPGCEAVHTILKGQGVKNFREHALFKESVRGGVITNPDLFEELESGDIVEETFLLRFEITNLFCPSCQDLIEWVLKKKKGVVRAVLDYSLDLCVIEYDPRNISKEEIYQVIRRLGYKIQELEAPEKKQVSLALYLRLGIASFFEKDSIDWTTLFGGLSFISALPIITYCAYPIYVRAFHGLIRGFLGMELLVTIGVISSFILSTYQLFTGGVYLYYDTLAVIITFVLLGRVLEAKAKFTTKGALISLFRSIPKKGRIGEKIVSIKEIEIGDMVTVYTGERAVLDGVIATGEGFVDESMLTGEAMPVLKKTGDTLLAGSIIQKGWFTFSVTKNEKESTLQSIVNLIEKSLGKKSQTQKVVDPIVRVFVPLVIFIALMARDFETALSVLLISCPCAIGIARPIVESKLIGLLLELGVVVKNRGALSFLGKEEIVVFDKTGTLTKKKMKIVTDLTKLSNSEQSILKTLAKHSIHPIASTLSEALKTISETYLEGIKEVLGKGVSCADYYMGSSKWYHEIEGVSSSLQGTFFWKKGEAPFTIVMEEEPKDEVMEVLEFMNQQNVYLFSGDASSNVEKLAHKLKISNFSGGLSPLEKQRMVLSLRDKGCLLMCGDGMNDAPSMASADLSFAPFHATEMTRSVADFILNKDDLTLIVQASKWGRFSRKIIYQNLFWAFFYNVIGIPLALFHLLNPIYATFAMMSSSLICLLNAKRLTTSNLK